MTIDFRPQGVCSQQMHVEMDENNMITRVEVLGGCSGNLQAVSRLVEGLSAEEAIRKIKGIHCGFKSTSCPDQLACGIERALQKKAKR